eukprot:2790497-Prymnesium_polylepis.1
MGHRAFLRAGSINKFPFKISVLCYTSRSHTGPYKARKRLARPPRFSGGKHAPAPRRHSLTTRERRRDERSAMAAETDEASVFFHDLLARDSDLTE